MIEVPHAEGVDQAAVRRLVYRIQKLIQHFGPVSKSLNTLHELYLKLLEKVEDATVAPLEAEVVRLETLMDSNGRSTNSVAGGGC